MPLSSRYLGLGWGCGLKLYDFLYPKGLEPPDIPALNAMIEGIISADLQVALKEIDAREKGATQNIKAETAKLKAALDRANGERMRLAYELANIKRQAA
jgi:hypothetical protein